MLFWSWTERDIWILGGGGGGAGGRWHVGVAIGVTAMAGLALAATIVISSRRGSLKSPWSRRKRKRALTEQQWKSLFTPEGKLRDGGVKFLKKVRSGGIDPNIRAEVWPFLLGVYDLSSTESERNEIRLQKRREFEKLRRRCHRLLNHIYGDKDMKGIEEVRNVDSPSRNEAPDPADSEDAFSSVPHPSTEEEITDGSSNAETIGISHVKASPPDEFVSAEFPHKLEEDKEFVSAEYGHAEDYVSGITHVKTESSSTESSSEEDTESILTSAQERTIESDLADANNATVESKAPVMKRTTEDFTTWQRIIRLDAIRANNEWVIYSPSQAAVSEEKAQNCAVSVGLKDYEHLEPSRIYHAARLVAVLEAYALYDPEIGYCQGMSDLLSPVIAVMEEDDEAFWCFVGFMRKARHNFRLDEVGIRRQLNIVSRIIKYKDSHLYRHLEKLQAEDCFFVYRMVVVLFRRELDFEQTLCLWEVMWADQAAIRARIGKSAWARIRLRAPPTEDLLLYAIAACVLQRRKLIIESYSSMDEIIRECNNMAGHLDVWKLLDDAHDLVVSLHDRV